MASPVHFHDQPHGWRREGRHEAPDAILPPEDHAELSPGKSALPQEPLRPRGRVAHGPSVGVDDSTLMGREAGTSAHGFLLHPGAMTGAAPPRAAFIHAKCPLHVPKRKSMAGRVRAPRGARHRLRVKRTARGRFLIPRSEFVPRIPRGHSYGRRRGAFPRGARHNAPLPAAQSACRHAFITPASAEEARALSSQGRGRRAQAAKPPSTTGVGNSSLSRRPGT